MTQRRSDFKGNKAALPSKPCAACGLGACAAEGIEAKRVGKEPNSALLLRTVAVATAGKTGLKWDFSPPVAADVLLPRRLLAMSWRRRWAKNWDEVKYCSDACRRHKAAHG